jgi:hypothetical protein
MLQGGAELGVLEFQSWGERHRRGPRRRRLAGATADARQLPLAIRGACVKGRQQLLLLLLLFKRPMRLRLPPSAVLGPQACGTLEASASFSCSNLRAVSFSAFSAAHVAFVTVLTVS